MRQGRWGLLALPAGWFIPGTALAQERGFDWWWGHPIGWMRGAWGIGMLLVLLLFWGTVILGIVVGIRWLEARAEDPGRIRP